VKISHVDFRFLSNNHFVDLSLLSSIYGPKKSDPAKPAREKVRKSDPTLPMGYPAHNFRLRSYVACVFQLDKECFHNLLFGDYMMPDREPDERVYEEVQSVDHFHQIVEQYLEDYNNVHKAHMNLVIFRCVSILSSPPDNVGDGIMFSGCSSVLSFVQTLYRYHDIS